MSKATKAKPAPQTLPSPAEPTPLRSHVAVNLDSSGPVKLKSVHFVSLMRLPGFKNMANIVYSGAEKTDREDAFHGSNKAYAETLMLVGRTIFINDFEIPVDGGGVLGWIRA